VVVPQPRERTRANPTTQKAQPMGRAKRLVERITASWEMGGILLPLGLLCVKVLDEKPCWALGLEEG
jgi:hypothetical protein